MNNQEKIIAKKNVSAILIAAGMSSRIGKFKPLLKYKGKTFLQTIVDKLLTVSYNIIIVSGHHSDLIKEEIDKAYGNKAEVKLVRNKDYKKGMFSSLQKGLDNNNAEWFLYHFIDQPNLPNEFYTNFINNTNEEFDWIQPINNRMKGHPILFNRKVGELILGADYGSSLRIISNRFALRKMYWECDNKEIFTDIDTLDDLKNIEDCNE